GNTRQVCPDVRSARRIIQYRRQCEYWHDLFGTTEDQFGNRRWFSGGLPAERNRSTGRRIFYLRVQYHDGLHHRAGSAWFHAGSQPWRISALARKYPDSAARKNLQHQRREYESVGQRDTALHRLCEAGGQGEWTPIF